MPTAGASNGMTEAAAASDRDLVAPRGKCPDRTVAKAEIGAIEGWKPGPNSPNGRVYLTLAKRP